MFHEGSFPAREEPRFPFDLVGMKLCLYGSLR
jgi:hypothetical protein